MRCPEGTCLSAGERCDRQMHCSDGSDEPITCGKINEGREILHTFFFKYSQVTFNIYVSGGRFCSMNNGGCSHMCTDEQWGAQCSCPAGYKLSPNGAVCQGVLDLIMMPFP